MAVFTKLEKKEIKDFLKNFSIGDLISFEGIVKGTENSNFKIITSKNKYILTILEKRVEEEDLPFFMSLQNELVEHGFNCPKPIKNNNNLIINKLKNKNAVIISFLDGENLSTIMPEHCYELGSKIAEFTNITKKLKLSRVNSLRYENWVKIYESFKNINDYSYQEYFSVLNEELIFLKKNWPINLPKAIIHADLFKDNIFFKKKKIAGVIDFYFSCYHFFLYDICIVINDWCFQNNGMLFKYDFLDAIIKGYRKKRKFTSEELNVFNVVLRAATVRILMTRLHDYIFHPKDAIVVKKDPFQYYNILKWHQENRLIL